MNSLKITLFFFLALSFQANPLVGQDHSIAHDWNEILLESIRKDFARPTVHARNLYHSSALLYDIWAVYTGNKTHFLGQNFHGYQVDFSGIPIGSDPESDMEEAMCYAMYSLLNARFSNSPGFEEMSPVYTSKMMDEGYDPSFSSMDYLSGNPAALGNYIANEMRLFGYQDGSNELNNYENQYYEPLNEPMAPEIPGNDDMDFYNNWQPLAFESFVDQSGNPFGGLVPEFLSPEWGKVSPFALSEDDLIIHTDDNGNPYYVYHQPETPPHINTTDGLALEDNYKWGFALVVFWSSHLASNNPVMMDISPASLGNIDVSALPTNYDDMRNFYDTFEGGDPSVGHDLNPHTGQPYPPNIVPRGDYARVLAEFWADGPDSETPPGHWFTLLNYVNEQPELEKRFNGQGEILSDLEWDVKSYLMLGGAMHDAAISAWGIKGYFDYVRPISAIRLMAELGQSTDPNLPNYHPGGFPLVPGFSELVEDGDPLEGIFNQHIGKVKVRAWRGPDYIDDEATDEAGVDWILAEEWWPYQRPTFVTPNFAGFISGHSTFSRAAAEVLTSLTGDPFFPGGVGKFLAPQNEFLVFEEGPSMDIELQWATYRDASDQTSLSRIWGGIHPPADDIPGRLIGIQIAEDVFRYSTDLFFNDADNDGVNAFFDCNDEDPEIYPGLSELCDDKDNDCNGEIDEDLPLFDYFIDQDGDNFGQAGQMITVCNTSAPSGYANNGADCDDTDININPAAAEICDDRDNNCNGIVNDGLTLYSYYLDNDEDGFGDSAQVIDTCIVSAPAGYVTNSTDCDDNDASVNPAAPEVCDGIDNNCNGLNNDGLSYFTYFSDNDGDGFGNVLSTLDTCLTTAPIGYVANADDCNDNDAAIHPDAEESCDDIDNNCNGLINEGLTRYIYYLDFDQDGFGTDSIEMDTCISFAPEGFVDNFDDCNDNDALINPAGEDIADNGIDEDCSGIDYYAETKLFPNPVQDVVSIHHEYEGELDIRMYDSKGSLVKAETHELINNATQFGIPPVSAGIYMLRIKEVGGNFSEVFKLVKAK